MIVLIPIEISARELLYKLYLCNQLSKKGFVCYIGYKVHIYKLTKLFKNYIYLDKGYHKNNSEKIYKIIKENGGVIYNLDEEGAVEWGNNQILNSRYSKELFNNSKKVFLWGESQFNRFKNNFVNDNALVTGHPRFELLKKKYHYLYNDSVKKLNKKHNNYILFNTNMAFGNNTKGLNFVKENYGSRLTNIDQIIETDNEKIKIYVSLIKKLSMIYSGKIIFRPHPEEDLNFYIDRFKEYKNVEVIFEGSAVDWIIGSDLVIHPDCTTGIESLMLGNVPISYMPENFDKNATTELPIKLSKRFNSEDEILNYLKEINFNHKNISIVGKDKLLFEYFGFNKNSTDLIVDEFSKESNNFKSENKIPLYYRIRIFVSSLLLRFSFDTETKFLRKKNKGFNLKNIKLLNSKLILNNKEFESNKLSLISYGLIKIKKKNN
jgi:surface carbohydrate biosynthesis protein